MPPRLLDAFNPLQRHLTDAERSLRTFRAACVGLGVLVLPFGWVLTLDPVEVVDPVAVRWLMAVGSLLLLAASFRTWFIARWSSHVNLGLSYALLLYFGWMGWANDLSSAFALGLFFVFVAMGLAQGVTYSDLRAYARYLVVSTTLVVLVALASAHASTHEGTLILSVLSVGLLLYYTVRARIEVLDDLAQSERHLAEAQEAAGLGSWEKDLRTGAVRWSSGMYRLTGLDPATSVPSAEAFAALAHPDDAARLTERSHTDDLLTVRYHRAGSTAWRHAEVRRSWVLGADGQPARVFGTIRDTTDAHAREAALHQALVHAQDAATAKSAFLANMSHEIRTPLTAILGYAELLADEADDAQRGLVEPIVVAGERLLVTLNSVLDLARMEAGETDLLRQPVDVAAEVEAVTRLLRQRASAKGIVLRTDVGGGPLVTLGDPAALSRVLTNLVSNAVKFTTDGEVVLRARGCPSERTVEIEVCDSGRGMTPEFLNLLFEPFQQASTGWARSHEGTGLGLTIVKRLVESMQGAITVESTLGEGTCFRVRLPMAPEVTDAPVLAPPSAREPVAA